MITVYAGIDAGSVSAKIAIIDEDRSILHSSYTLHRGDPLGAASHLSIEAAEKGFTECLSLAITGSARKITARSA
ncbi:MAG TPA: 2-hydroxyglutaryl-CoA dehydratase, partial [Spirochaetota bacterium]